MRRASIAEASLQFLGDANPAEGQSGTIMRAVGAVLIVDDDVQAAANHDRVLREAGFHTHVVTDPHAALALLRQGVEFDAIVTDVTKPSMDGVTLLREIRRHDMDVPVVLLAANPTLETAVTAMKYGGFRYLPTPVDATELSEAVSEAASMHKLARLKREALSLLETQQKQHGDRASLEVHFEQALERLWVAYQPIVNVKERRVFAYEALVRSDESTLSRPDLLFDAAERLGQLWVLGRRIRQLVGSVASQWAPSKFMFVNLHAIDLSDEELYDPNCELAQYAERIVFEITERASLDQIRDIRKCIRRLRGLGYHVAVDDVGAGYAGLSCFGSLEPDVAKLDMSLVRDIDCNSRLQSIVRSVLSVCAQELDIRVVCEGVETTRERDTLISLGANLMQGYLFARPERVFPEVDWHDGK